MFVFLAASRLFDRRVALVAMAVFFVTEAVQAGCIAYLRKPVASRILLVPVHSERTAEPHGLAEACHRIAAIVAWRPGWRRPPCAFGARLP